MRLPSVWIVILAGALGVVAIVIASASGLQPRPAAWAGACVALLILAWGWVREA